MWNIKNWLQRHNPYKYWWDVRKIVKRPKWHLYHIGKMTWFYGMPICNDYYDRIIDIRIEPLGWKDKYYTPRHEWNPYICITLFRKWQIIWMLCFSKGPSIDSILNNEETWEAVLELSVDAYSDLPYKDIIKRHTWKDSKKTYDIKHNLKCGT